ncbi:MAG TPA: CAP domain-containing protein [Gaiellaceae bacterium]
MVVVVSAFAFSALAGEAKATPTAAELAMLQAMNAARQAHGVGPLRIDTRLQRTARSHSRVMLRTDSFSHGAFAARIRRAGVRARRVGENLAWAIGALAEAHAIVNLWLASPEHRANLLRPGYHIVGVGIRVGSFEGYAGASVVTTDFAGR